MAGELLSATLDMEPATAQGSAMPWKAGGLNDRSVTRLETSCGLGRPRRPLLLQHVPLDREEPVLS